jgi:hypothetical protein
MTPKEKAEKLVSDFYSINCKLIEVKYGYDMGNRYDLVFPKCKQCALIAVDELINTEYQTVSKLLDVIQKNKIRLVISLNKDYWQEVKQEIEKL